MQRVFDLIAKQEYTVLKMTLSLINFGIELFSTHKNDSLNMSVFKIRE